MQEILKDLGQFILDFQGVSNHTKLVLMTMLRRSNGLSKSVAVHFLNPFEGVEKEIWDEVIEGKLLAAMNDELALKGLSARFMRTSSYQNVGGRLSLQHRGSSGDSDIVIPYGPGFGMLLLITRRAKELVTDEITAKNFDLFLGEGQLVVSVSSAKAVSVIAAFREKYPHGEIEYHFPGEVSSLEAKSILKELEKTLGVYQMFRCM